MSRRPLLDRRISAMRTAIELWRSGAQVAVVSPDYHAARTMLEIARTLEPALCTPQPKGWLTLLLDDRYSPDRIRGYRNVEIVKDPACHYGSAGQHIPLDAASEAILLRILTNASHSRR